MTDRAAAYISRGLWAIAWAIIFLAMVGCQRPYLSDAETRMIYQRFDYIQGRSPVDPPNIQWTRDRNFGLSGETNCITHTITMSALVAEHDLHFFMYKVIPHEWAHHISCEQRGNTDGGVPGGEHDEFWKEWVIRLGGDPEYI
jgi:hypothetical protein